MNKIFIIKINGKIGRPDREGINYIPCVRLEINCVEVAETSHVKKKVHKETRNKLFHMNIPIGKKRGELVLVL